MKGFFALLASLCLFSLTDPAQASVFTNRVDFDGGEDTLADESNGAFVDNGVAGFSTGDIIYGFMRISNIDPSGGPNVAISEQIVFVFSVAITGGSGTAVDPYDLSAVASGDDYSLSTLLAGTGLALPGGGVMDNAFALLLTNPSVSPDDSPLNFEESTPEEEMQLFKAVDGWTYEAAIGFDTSFDGKNRHGDTDFFEAQVLTTTLILEFGGGSILDHIWGATTTFLPVTANHVDPSTFSNHDITLEALTFTTQLDTPWNFRDNAFLRINPTPEPASLTAWAIGLATVGAFAARRRRKLAAAQQLAA